MFSAGCNGLSQNIGPLLYRAQGRYNTQPRMAKATSMSVLNRLAHPLMGYDSMGALAPKARKRRQESVERVSQTLNRPGNICCLGPVKATNTVDSMTAVLVHTCNRGCFSNNGVNTGTFVHSSKIQGAVLVRRRFSVGGVSREQNIVHFRCIRIDRL